MTTELFNLNERSIDLIRREQFNAAIDSYERGLEYAESFRQARVAELGEDGESMNSSSGGPTSIVRPVPLFPLASSPAMGTFSLYRKPFTILENPNYRPGSRGGAGGMNQQNRRRDNSRLLGDYLDENLAAALPTEVDCCLWGVVFRYNLGLCILFKSLADQLPNRRNEGLAEALDCFRIALEDIYPWDEEPSFLLLEMALLSNSCCIHSVLVPRTQESEAKIRTCRDRMQVCMTPLRRQRRENAVGARSVPAADIAFFQNHLGQAFGILSNRQE